MSGTSARPLLIMTCATKSSPGEGHAPLSLYHHSSRRPRLRRATVPASRPPQGSRPQVQSVCFVGGPVLGRQPHQLAGRRLRQPARGALGQCRPRRLAGYLARLCRAATPPQPRPRRRPAQGPAPTSPAAGVRPDLGALPRPAPALRRRGLPRSGQEWHHPLPRLRHLLRPPQGPTLHRRPDRREACRAAGGGSAAAVAAGGAGWRAAALLAVGQGVLLGGGHPLPAAGALRLADAAGGTRPPSQPPRRPLRQPGVPHLEAWRLGAVHHDGQGRRDGHVPCVRQVPQPARRAGPARTRDAGVRLGRHGPALVAAMGQGDLPPALRHRDQLPADAPGTHPHQYARPAVAAVVRGRGPDPAQRLGVAALGGAVATTTGRPADRPGPTDLPRHAAVAAALRRSMARSEGRNPRTTTDPQMTYAIHCEAMIMESTETVLSLIFFSHGGLFSRGFHEFSHSLACWPLPKTAII